MRIAFYAPLKPPDHPVPSGDREIARLLMRALQRSGHEVTLASQLRSYTRSPDATAQERLKHAAEKECVRLLRHWSQTPAQRPDLWFTYHPYYKAPDWLGPSLAASLHIPYVTAEASYAGKRDRDEWCPWQADVAEQLRRAALHLCMTARDMDGLISLLGPDAPVASLPPFIDCAAADPVRSSPGNGKGPVRLMSVAMMRPGDKLASYHMLAEALCGLSDRDWQLTIIGDGSERPRVEAVFAPLAQRVTFTGQLPPDQVAAHLANGDMYVWPGFGEAYGLAYLEAQNAGLPVVAQNTGGIASVVSDGVTGLLTEPGNIAAYQAALLFLLENHVERARMGLAARDHVRSSHSLESAAQRLDALLSEVMA